MNGFARMARLALPALLFLLVASPLLPAQTGAASEHFRLDGGFSSASGQSSGASFRLTACLGEWITGSASSRSYRVLSGYMSFLDDQPVMRFQAGSPAHPLPGSGPAASPSRSWTFSKALSLKAATMAASTDMAKAGNK